MGTGQKKRVGRPTKEATAGMRASLGLRVTAETKRKLDAAAEKAGRSQSQEAEFRLERSFLDQDLLYDALELRYGKGLAGILLTIGEAMQTTGRLAGFWADPPALGDDWLSDPYAFAQATQAAQHAIDALKPAGDTRAPGKLPIEAVGGLPIGWGHVEENLGKYIANGLLQEIAADHPTTTRAIELAPRLRKALGMLVDRVKEYIRSAQ
jgi:hypothetical protein